MHFFCEAKFHSFYRHIKSPPDDTLWLIGVSKKVVYMHVKRCELEIFYQLTCEVCMKVASRQHRSAMPIISMRFAFSIYLLSLQINSCKIIATMIEKPPRKIYLLHRWSQIKWSIESDKHHLLIMLFIAFFNVATCVHRNLKRHMFRTWKCHANDTWRGNLRNVKVLHRGIERFWILFHCD